MNLFIPQKVLNNGKRFFRLFKCSLQQEKQVSLLFRTVLLKMVLLLLQTPPFVEPFFILKSAFLTIALTWTFRASSLVWEMECNSGWIVSKVAQCGCLSLSFAFSVSLCLILSSSSVVVHPGYLWDKLNPCQRLNVNVNLRVGLVEWKYFTEVGVCMFFPIHFIIHQVKMGNSSHFEN